MLRLLLGPFRGLLVITEGFLLGLEVVEGFMELLPEVFLDLMLVRCVLAAWVLPFGPSLFSGPLYLPLPLLVSYCFTLDDISRPLSGFLVPLSPVCAALGGV